MTDQTIVPKEGEGLAASGQAAIPPEPIVPAQGQLGVTEGTEAFVTKEDFNKFADETKQWLKRTTDSTEGRLKNEVEAGFRALDERVQQLKIGGIEVSDQQVKAAKQQIVDNAINQPTSPQPADGPPAVQLTAEQKETATRVDAGIKTIMEETGVALYTHDPEAKGLDAIHDPDIFLEVFKTKSLEKKERVGKEGDPTAPPPEAPQQKPSTNPALTTGGGAVNNISEITDTTELFGMAKEKYSW